MKQLIRASYCLLVWSKLSELSSKLKDKYKREVYGSLKLLVSDLNGKKTLGKKPLCEILWRRKSGFLLRKTWYKLIFTCSVSYSFDSLVLSYPHPLEHHHVCVWAVWPGSLMCSTEDKGLSQHHIMPLWWFLIGDSKLFWTDLLYDKKSSVAMRLSLPQNLLTSGIYV